MYRPVFHATSKGVYDFGQYQINVGHNQPVVIDVFRFSSRESALTLAYHIAKRNGNRLRYFIEHIDPE